MPTAERLPCALGAARRRVMGGPNNGLVVRTAGAGRRRDASEGQSAPEAGPLTLSSLRSRIITTYDVDEFGPCAVCQEAFKVDDWALFLNREAPSQPNAGCRHLFHGSCLLPWLLKHHTCPVCRAFLEVDEHQLRFYQTALAASLETLTQQSSATALAPRPPVSAETTRCRQQAPP